MNKEVPESIPTVKDIKDSFNDLKKYGLRKRGKK